MRNIISGRSAAQPILCALSLMLAVFVIYSPVRNFSFINFDDNIYVTENSYINRGLSWRNFVWAFSDSAGGHWHPLTWLGHMTIVQLFGLNPGDHHLVNVFLHSINTALLFLIISRLIDSKGLAFFSAAVIGLHPMRLESVAWVSELKDLLSIFFALLATLSYISYAKRGSLNDFLLILFFYALGLLAKPTILTLPILFLLLDFWPLKRSALRHSLVEKLPLIVMSMFAVAFTMLFQEREGAVVSFEAIPIAERFYNAFVSYLIYLGKFFMPLGLGIFYPFRSYNIGTGLGAFLIVLGISWLLIRNYRSAPSLIFGWLWFLVALSPVIGIIQFGGQAYADRWTYIPHIGLTLGLAYWCKENLKVGAQAFKLLGSTIVILFAVWTALELPNWKDSQSLFSHTLKISPQNFMAHTNLGSALDNAGKLAEAAPHYEEAYRLNPTYPEAINNLGSLRARQGKMEEAAALFNRALSLRPTFAIAKSNLNLARARLGYPAE